MSYYDPQAWQLPGQMRDLKEPSWEQQQAPSRSDTASARQGPDAGAFHSQIEDVDRAIDNLAKSGKLLHQTGRRDSIPMMGGPESFSSYQSSRMGGMGGRHHSIDFSDQIRPHSGSGLQNFYANQRHQPRPNEAEQMMQAKRRMAAQRERELRNYHQEQQYNRNVTTKGSNPDRAISPNTINEEDRRELIARQHRALYGNESGPYNEGQGYGDDGQTPRPSFSNSNTTSAAGGRGPSPRTYDPFSMGQNQNQNQNQNQHQQQQHQQQQSLGEQGGQFKSSEQNQQTGGKGPSPNPQQQTQRAESTASPASNPPGQNFPLFESAAQQSSRTSTSSPGGSPPRQQGKTSAPGVAPIGTRPTTQSQSSNLAPTNNKRSGTPSSLSPLNNNNNNNPNSNSNYESSGLNAPSSAGGNERSTSALSNPTGSSGGGGSTKDSNVSSWGQANSSSGPWGSSNSSKLQASVWG